MDWKEDETSNSFSLSKLKNPSFLSQQEFVDKYDYNPPVKLSIDKFYFLKTFGSSFLYFLIFFFYYFILVKIVFFFYFIFIYFIIFYLFLYFFLYFFCFNIFLYLVCNISYSFTFIIYS